MCGHLWVRKCTPLIQTPPGELFIVIFHCYWGTKYNPYLIITDLNNDEGEYTARTNRVIATVNRPPSKKHPSWSVLDREFLCSKFARVEQRTTQPKQRGVKAVVDGQWIEISYYLVHLVIGEAFIWAGFVVEASSKKLYIWKWSTERWWNRLLEKAAAATAVIATWVVHHYSRPQSLPYSTKEINTEMTFSIRMHPRRAQPRNLLGHP